MKKIFTLLTAVCFTAAVNAQIVAPSVITTNTTWTSNNVYELNGFVYVKNGATLTIEPGTLIKGDRANKGTLIVTRGSKLMAVGTKTRPIVFTSKEDAGDRGPGDWGGVVLLGRAPINPPGGETQAEGGINNAAGDGLYGGTNPNDNSGRLSFVRIEFPGIPLSQEANSEINGLTMGGVGSGTIIDHIQVSFSGDDSYEWFGGNVNARYLIAVRGQDDEFDTDFGFTGKVQFGLSMRNPSLADQSGSNGFESDNDGGQGSTNTPITAPVFSNMTLIGPKSISPTFDANFRRALHLRRNTKTSIFNSVFTGYPLGLRLDGANTLANVNAQDLKFRNNIIADCTTPYDTVNMGPNAGFNIASWFNTSGWGNENLATTAAVGYTNPSNLDNPNFTPITGAAVLSGASFTDAKLQDPFFVPVTFRGAIGQENWTECWANFNPNAPAYTSGPIITGATADFSFSQQAFAYTVDFTNASADATSYNWSFGDGESSTESAPSHTFTGAGTYNITLTASRTNGCDSVITKEVVVNIVGIEDIANAYGLSVRPNPANEIAVVDFNLKSASETSIEILDLAGKTIQIISNSKLSAGKQSISLNTSALSAGLYIIRIQSGGAAQSLRLAIGK